MYQWDLWIKSLRRVTSAHWRDLIVLIGETKKSWLAFSLLLPSSKRKYGIYPLSPWILISVYSRLRLAKDAYDETFITAIMAPRWYEIVQYWGSIILYPFSSDSAASPGHPKVDTRDILNRVLFAEKALQSEFTDWNEPRTRLWRYQNIARPFSLSKTRGDSTADIRKSYRRGVRISTTGPVSLPLRRIATLSLTLVEQVGVPVWAAGELLRTALLKPEGVEEGLCAPSDCDKDSGMYSVTQQ